MHARNVAKHVYKDFRIEMSAQTTCGLCKGGLVDYVKKKMKPHLFSTNLNACLEFDINSTKTG